MKRKRADGWIVEDEGGYVEDGREIFDDDEDDLYETTAASSLSGKRKGEKEKTKKEGVKGRQKYFPLIQIF